MTKSRHLQSQNCAEYYELIIMILSVLFLSNIKEKCPGTKYEQFINLKNQMVFYPNIQAKFYAINGRSKITRRLLQ